MSDLSRVAPGNSAPGETSNPSLTDLAIAFGTMGVSGFGGVLPWARRVLVEERRWLSAEQFNELFALCHFLPGPNIINFAIVFGSRKRGAAGAAVCIAALVVPPMAIVMALGALYARYEDVAVLQRVLAGLAAAAAGLLVAMALKMAEPLLRSRSAAALAVAAVTFVAMGVLKLPLLWIVAVLAPLSIGLAWWNRQ